MTKVTNNHSAPLNVAGVDVRPRATVEVDTGAFDKWTNGYGAKQWLKQGIISADAEVNTAFTADISDEGLTNAQDDREALLKEARALGLNPNANTGVDKLKKMIADKKAA